MDEKKLERMERKAKVTTGGESVFSLFNKMVKGQITSRKEADSLSHSILEKVKMDVPIFTIVDCSYSMVQRDRTKGLGFPPIAAAQFLTSVVLTKNPDPDLQEMFMIFNNNAHMIYNGIKGVDRTNKYVAANKVVTIDDLFLPKRPFMDNVNSLGRVIQAAGGTNLASIAKTFRDWIKSEPGEEHRKIEMLMKYQVFLIISDGDFNNSFNARSSLKDMQQIMLELGTDPVFVIWNISANKKTTSDFEGMENVVEFYGYNASIINQIFSSLSDIEIVDSYSVLKGLYNSNRYKPVLSRIAEQRRSTFIGILFITYPQTKESYMDSFFII